MKHPNYDRAFHRTPDYIRSAIELGFLKGKRRMKARHRLSSALTAAAMFLVLLGAGAYGVSRLAMPGPDHRVGETPLSAGTHNSNALRSGERGDEPAPSSSASAASNASPKPARRETSAGDDRNVEADQTERATLPDGGEIAAEALPAAEVVFEASATPTQRPVRAEGSPMPTPPPTAQAPSAQPTPEPEAPTPGLDPTLAPDLPLARLTAYAGGDANPCFHLENPCGGAELPQEMDLAIALREGLAPCPDCVEGRGYRLLAFCADGSGKVAVRDGLWYTELGNYLHVDSNCSGMANARKHGIAEAFASGKRTCPVCMDGWTCAAALDVPEAEAALAQAFGGATAEPTGASIAVAPAPEAEVREAVEAAPGVEPTPSVASALEAVYYTEEGRYFHAEPDCSVLRAEEGGSVAAEGSDVNVSVTIMGSLMDATRAGKDVCPVCLAGWDFVLDAAPTEEVAERGTEEWEEVVEYEAVRAESIEEEIATVFAAADGGEYCHRSDACGGEALPRELSVAQALSEGLTPCPDCLPEGAYSLIAYYEMDGSEVSLAAVWYTEGGKFFHSSMYCDGMWGAAIHPIAEAFAGGKSACPRCMEGWAFALRRVAEAPTEAQIEMAKPTPKPARTTLPTSEPASDSFSPEEREEVEGAIAISGSGGEPYDISHKFYYTPNGKYYHMAAGCSGMIGATRHSAAETAASGKKHCPVCIGDKLSYYWLPAPREDGDYDTPNLYFAEQDAWVPSVWGDAGNVFVPLEADDGQPSYYHVNPECFGMNGARMIPWDEAKANGLGPCPACLPVWNSGGSREICYVSDGDALYHLDPNCPAARNAREAIAIDAQAEGRLRCPACAQGSAPAAWTEVREELGASIAAAYPGWNFERADEFEDRVEWFVSNGEESMRAAILRFAEETSDSNEAPLREITLEHGNFATRYFPQSFIESLPSPLNAIPGTTNPTQIFLLTLEYQNGRPTAFTTGETSGTETNYTTWAIHADNTAEITPKN